MLCTAPWAFWTFLMLQHISYNTPLLIRALFTEAGLSTAEYLGLVLFAPPFRSSKSCWVDRKVPPSFVPTWSTTRRSSPLDGCWRFLCQCLKVATLIPPYSLLPFFLPEKCHSCKWAISSPPARGAGWEGATAAHLSSKSQGAAPTKTGPWAVTWHSAWERKPVCHLLLNGVTSRQSWGAPVGTTDKIALLTLYSSCPEDDRIIERLGLKKTLIIQSQEIPVSNLKMWYNIKSVVKVSLT